jgi:hypothetical protein
VVTLYDGGALPDFIVQNGDTVEITPLDHTDMGEFLLKITQTPDNGAPSDFDSLRIDVSCTITSIDTVAPPTTGLTYTLYDTTLPIDLSSNVYVQVPPCGYTLVNDFTWTIDAASPITVDAGNEQMINVISLDRNKLGTHSVVLTNVITYPAQSFTETETISFDIEIIDPCLLTTMYDIIFTPGTLTVVNGETATVEFPDATDSVETDNNIFTLCGDRTYAIFENDETNTPDWLTLTHNTDTDIRTIEAAPVLDNLVGSHTMKIKTEFTRQAYIDAANYIKWTSLTVDVNGAICDQNGLGWSASNVVTATIDVSTGPTDVTIAPYTPDPASKLATPEMRACGGFDETYTVAAVQSGEVSLPSFITHDGNGLLTVTPTTSAHMGTWTI